MMAAARKNPTVELFILPLVGRMEALHRLAAERDWPLRSVPGLTSEVLLRDLATTRRDDLPDLGRQGQDYVRRHHSLEFIGTTFARINRELDVFPK